MIIKLITLFILTLLLASCGNSVNNQKSDDIISSSWVDIKIAEDIDNWEEISVNSWSISVKNIEKNEVKVSSGKVNISSNNWEKIEVNSWVNISNSASWEIIKETQETLKDIEKLLNSIN